MFAKRYFNAIAFCICVGDSLHVICSRTKFGTRRKDDEDHALGKLVTSINREIADGSPEIEISITLYATDECRYRETCSNGVTVQSTAYSLPVKNFAINPTWQPPWPQQRTARPWR